jgi:hypothetical protein
VPLTKAFWIIVDGTIPTAFRSPNRDELLPTLHQLQRTQPTVALVWFERGRIWATQEEARADQERRRKLARERKDSWRPGGSHVDPRAKYKIPRDEKRARFKRRATFDRQRAEGDAPPFRDRPFGDRPRGDRPFAKKPFGAKPYGSKFGRKPFGDRPQGDRPRSDRPRSDRPPGDRPFRDKPFDKRPPRSFDRDDRDRDRGSREDRPWRPKGPPKGPWRPKAPGGSRGGPRGPRGPRGPKGR